MKTSFRSLLLITLFTALLPSTSQAYTRGVYDNPGLARYEAKVMGDLIDQLYAATVLNQLWEERTIHEEKKTAFQQLIQQNQMEIQTLTKWLQEWYGVTHEPRLRGAIAQQARSLSRLSLDRFEMRFLLAMIRHQNRTALLAEQAGIRARSSYLTQFVPGLATASKGQADSLTQWLCYWYQICPRAVRP